MQSHQHRKRNPDLAEMVRSHARQPDELYCIDFALAVPKLYICSLWLDRHAWRLRSCPRRQAKGLDWALRQLLNYTLSENGNSKRWS